MRKRATYVSADDVELDAKTAAKYRADRRADDKPTITKRIRVPRARDISTKNSA